MSAVANAWTPARWQTVKAILADALEHPDAAGRAAFVAGACAGDAELRREVESLLAHVRRLGHGLLFEVDDALAHRRDARPRRPPVGSRPR